MTKVFISISHTEFIKAKLSQVHGQT